MTIMVLNVPNFCSHFGVSFETEILNIMSWAGKGRASWGLCYMYVMLKQYYCFLNQLDNNNNLTLYLVFRLRFIICRRVVLSCYYWQ